MVLCKRRAAIYYTAVCVDTFAARCRSSAFVPLWFCMNGGPTSQAAAPAAKTIFRFRNNHQYCERGMTCSRADAATYTRQPHLAPLSISCLATPPHALEYTARWAGISSPPPA